MYVNDFFRRNLELQKEHANVGKMAINGNFAATTLVFSVQ
jgi:hypothetical protein